ALDGQHVLGLLDDADDARVTVGRRAVRARIDVRDHAADRAVRHAILDREHRRGERFDLVAGTAQQMVGKPLRALGADTRQPLERRHQLGERIEAVHQVRPGILSPPIMPCMCEASASSTLRWASLSAATIRSCSISTSSFETTSGSISSDSTFLWPFTLTVTMPPP